MTTQQWIKTVARWTGVVLSILSVTFAVVSYTQVFRTPGLNLETAVWFWREGENRAFSRA